MRALLLVLGAALVACATAPAETDPAVRASFDDVHARIVRAADARSLETVQTLHIVAPLGAPSEREPGMAEDDEESGTGMSVIGTAVDDGPADRPATKDVPRSASEAAERNAKVPPVQGDSPNRKGVPGAVAPTAPAETRDPASHYAP